MYVSIEEFLSRKEEQDVIKAIRQAELNTSGEIRIHLENSCEKDPMTRAHEVFAILDMHNTQQQNAVLIYVAVNDQQFAIYGDKGIDKVVGADFWTRIKDEMASHFKAEAYAKGLAEGVKGVGEQLKSHFPWHPSDENELPDSLSTS
ncbi:MAG: TPM domain-containing protein [Bacteroidia bacterium]|nr:TPM domain-containing protein [Bacteroidia bacterium]MBT8268256.1 TPM domain-containing protein [Bacteroidia bacterium]NNK70845.1 TPM domain-containing protein [Flavobacteriaceae bacterium]NNL81096.1 TPM domain-containing protein [Flavobacteriaceae bacterium]